MVGTGEPGTREHLFVRAGVDPVLWYVEAALLCTGKDLLEAMKHSGQASCMVRSQQHVMELSVRYQWNIDVGSIRLNHHGAGWAARWPIFFFRALFRLATAGTTSLGECADFPDGHVHGGDEDRVLSGMVRRARGKRAVRTDRGGGRVSGGLRLT